MTRPCSSFDFLTAQPSVSRTDSVGLAAVSQAKPESVHRLGLHENRNVGACPGDQPFHVHRRRAPTRTFWLPRRLDSNHFFSSGDRRCDGVTRGPSFFDNLRRLLTGRSRSAHAASRSAVLQRMQAFIIEVAKIKETRKEVNFGGSRSFKPRAIGVSSSFLTATRTQARYVNRPETRTASASQTSTPLIRGVFG